MGDLTLIKSLGKDEFGEVFLTSKQGHKEKFLTRKIERKFADDPKFKFIIEEIAILNKINHENIIKLYELKKTSQNFYFVTEYCNGGNLAKYLEKYLETHKAPFPEELVQHFMRQIVSAVKYLHDKRIIHRDIKLNYILVHFDSEEDKNNKNLLKAKVKIIDFKFSRYLKKGELAKSILGSPINMDPSILRRLNKLGNSKEFGYDEKADIWSLGTMCYEMLIGRSAFDAEDMEELVSLVEKGNYFLPSTLSMEAVSFINGMLKYDPKKRFSSEQLYRHEFLNKNFTDFHKINLNKIKENIKDSKIKMNTKLNETIWDILPERYYNGIMLNGVGTQPESTFEGFRKKLSEESSDVVTDSDVCDSYIERKRSYIC